MSSRLFVCLTLLALAACMPRQEMPVKIIGGNIEGVAVLYQGPAYMLRDTEVLARTHCERYSRRPALMNEMPTEDGTLAYYQCFI